ncbi:hypothetical protein ACW9YV_16720 (plasmid) [Paraburkholderia strydomiana]
MGRPIGKKEKADANVGLSMIHSTSKWLERKNGRPFEDRLEADAQSRREWSQFIANRASAQPYAPVFRLSLAGGAVQRTKKGQP